MRRYRISFHIKSGDYVFARYQDSTSCYPQCAQSPIGHQLLGPNVVHAAAVEAIVALSLTGEYHRCKHL